MRTVMVRYQVKADRVEENEAAVREVYAELERKAPAGIRYSTVKLADGVTFMHLAHIDTPDGQNPLLGLEAFKSFSAGVKDRCQEPPVTTELTIVGSYRMLG